LLLAEGKADELVDAGAQAVVLMGSFARGDETAFSDLDLLALGDGPAYRLELQGGQLLAINWSSVSAIESSFASPERAGYAVQGWRDALILRDATRLAARLQQRAREWDWSEPGDRAIDRYVADELCGLAEEVHKLAGLLASGNYFGAAVQRNILGFRIGAILAVHLRLLYATENELWNLVGDLLGDEWTTAQARALGTGDQDFASTCLGALELYELAVERVHTLFDPRERDVVANATMVGRSLLGGRAR
jgi:hypothetical protein